MRELADMSVPEVLRCMLRYLDEDGYLSPAWELEDLADAVEEWNRVRPRP